MSIPRDDPLKPRERSFQAPARGVRGVKISEDFSVPAHALGSHTGDLGDIGAATSGHLHLPLNNYDAAVAPTVTDDFTLGYGPGSEWVDVTNDKAYVCLDATPSAAVWTETTQTAAGAAHDHASAGDGGVLTGDRHDSFGEYDEIAAPGTPSAARVRIYAKSDGKMYRKDDAGTEAELGGGGNVTKVGTPVNNQLGIWTGDGTIEGDAALTYDGTSLNLATAKNLQIAGATVLADAAGTTTLSNIDALDATTEATIEAAIDTLSNLTTVGALASGSLAAGFTDVPVEQGGTGVSTLADGGVLIGNGTSAVEVLAIPASEGDSTHADRFLRGDATASTSPSWKAVSQQYCITIETPVATDNITIGWTREAITIQEIEALVRGGTSVDWNLYMDPTRTTETTKLWSSDKQTATGATGVNYNSGSANWTAASATIAAGDFIFVKVSAIGGTPTEFHLTIRYTTT